MSTTTQIRTSRREAIRQLLLNGPAANQRRLVDALTAQGYVATQSSVSRDLKEIGAIKTGLGYELPEADAEGVDEIARVTSLLRKLTPAGPHLLVIKTAIGAAQRVALVLDRSGWTDIIGTVAGDDTVFVATPSAQSQRRVLSLMDRSGESR